MRQCTVEYTQRMEDIALEAAHLVRLRIGNKYNFICFKPRPKHQWTVEVELEAQEEACLPRGTALPDIIKHVRFGMAPAFRVMSRGLSTASEAERNQVPPRYIEVDSAPFQVTATSPMSCTVPIIITWQDWIGQPPLRLEHQLDFRRDGGCWDYGVDLHNTLTGQTLEDLAQAQGLQRQQDDAQWQRESARRLALNDLERVQMDALEQRRLTDVDVSSQMSEATYDSQAKSAFRPAQRKRVGPFSAAWSQVCRHLGCTQLSKVQEPTRSAGR